MTSENTAPYYAMRLYAILTMKYTRLYCDVSGSSRLEEVEVAFSSAEFAPPAPSLDVATAVPASAHLFIRLHTGWFDPAHPAPARQFMVVLSGVVELEASGQTRRLGAGDIILAEDTEGPGHATARCRGLRCCRNPTLIRR